MRDPSSGDGSSGVGIDLASLIALRQEAGRLQITPRGKVLATRSGGHLSRFRGRGMEFDESRVYQPGDDPRNMDWRVTARSSVAHVKLFREERERPVWLLVDSGPGMRFGTRVAFKSVVAAQAAALLAWAAVDKGDRVGGVVFDEDRRIEYRPAARTRALLPLLNGLAQLTGVHNGSAPVPAHRSGFGSLAAAAGHLVNLVRPGSLVFLISDFSGLGQQDSGWMARLAAGSEVVFVQVHDALEVTAPPAGHYPVTDGSSLFVLDTAGTGLRRHWAKRFTDHTAMLQQLCRRYQAHLIGLRTDQAVGEVLRQGLRPQGRRPGGIR